MASIAEIYARLAAERGNPDDPPVVIPPDFPDEPYPANYLHPDDNDPLGFTGPSERGIAHLGGNIAPDMLQEMGMWQPPPVTAPELAEEQDLRIGASWLPGSWKRYYRNRQQWNDPLSSSIDEGPALRYLRKIGHGDPILMGLLQAAQKGATEARSLLPEAARRRILLDADTEGDTQGHSGGVAVDGRITVFPATISAALPPTEFGEKLPTAIPLHETAHVLAPPLPERHGWGGKPYFTEYGRSSPSEQFADDFALWILGAKYLPRTAELSEDPIIKKREDFFRGMLDRLVRGTAPEATP